MPAESDTSDEPCVGTGKPLHSGSCGLGGLCGLSLWLIARPPRCRSAPSRFRFHSSSSDGAAPHVTVAAGADEESGSTGRKSGRRPARARRETH